MGRGDNGGRGHALREPVAVTPEARLRRAKRKAPRVRRPYQRQWFTCSRCGCPQCLDYVPFTLSNPILVPRCGHAFEDLISVGRPQKASLSSSKEGT